MVCLADVWSTKKQTFSEARQVCLVWWAILYYLCFCGQIPIIYKMFQSGIEIDVAFLRLRQTDSMTVKLVNGGRRPLGGLQVVGRTWRRILEVVFLQVFSYQQYYITFFIQKAKVCISNIIFALLTYVGSCLMWVLFQFML